MSNSFKNTCSTNNKVADLDTQRLIREANNYFIHFRDYETALKKITEALKLNPNRIKALILKGEILFRMERKNESLEYFDKAINTDPCCIEAYGSKAGTLDILGKQREALACCQKAFENISSRDIHLLPALYDQKIALLLRLKKYKEARNVLKNCVTSIPAEDSSYLISCYRELIESSYRKRMKKFEKLKEIQLTLVN